MRFNKSVIWKWVPGFLLSFIAILALLKLVPLDQAIEVLRNVPVTYYLLSALFTFIFLLVRAIGWRALLSLRPSYMDTFKKLSLGYFVNNIFPFRLGEIARALYMGESIKVNPGQVLSSIFLERVFDLIILAFFLLIMLPYVVEAAWMRTTAWIILGVMIVGLLILFLVLRNSEKLLSFLNRFEQKNNLLVKLVSKFFRALLIGFESIKNPKYFLIGFVGVLGSWLVSFVQFSFFLRLFVNDSKWWWGIFANSALALGIALPSAPAGLGLYESSIVAGLKLFQVQEPVALAFALVMHISQFILIAILGLIALSKDGTSLTNLFSQLVDFKNQAGSKPIVGEGNG